MKVYIARHKDSGKIFAGKKTVYEDKAGLKVAMKRNWDPADVNDYDILSYVFHLDDMELEE